MQVKLRQLAESWGSLQKIANIEAGKGLTLKQAYWIGKVAKATEDEVKQIDALRAKLFDAFGEVVDDQQRIKEEHVGEFTRQIEDALESIIDIPGQPIPIGDLSESLPLSAADLLRLSWLIAGE